MGCVFTCAGVAFSWLSKIQSCPTQPLTKGEYHSLSHASKEAVWVKSQLLELRVPLSVPFFLYCYNQGANALMKEAQFHDKSKHIYIPEQVTRNQVEQKETIVNYIPTISIVANIVTKSLPRVVLENGCRGCCQDAYLSKWGSCAYSTV